jgi:Cu2+-exporting ATPase
MDVTVALALTLAYGASVVNTLRGTGAIYYDSVTMFVFFLLAGRFIEMTVRQQNMSATEALARSLPATVTRIGANGTPERIAPTSIAAGDVLAIPTGAVIPVNARLEGGVAVVDESLLSGESIPVPKHGDALLMGGSINVGHPLRVVATGPAAESMLANIVRLLERAQAERPSIARAADRVAAWFVLVTILLAMTAAVFWLFIDPSKALPAALAVLVVTCPCALSLATPAAMAAATTRLARLGLLVTKPDALERLASVTAVVIDKTGTLTCGTPTVELQSLRGGYSREEVLEISAALETVSDHPIALAFRAYWKPGRAVSSAREHVGRGVEGVVGGRWWRVGMRHFVTEAAAATGRDDTGIVLGNSDGIVATFALADRLRADAAGAVQTLRDMGLEVSIASGDQTQVVRDIAHQLGIREAVGRLDPERKLALVQKRQAAGERVLMVGDGINDGPVLASASVSCAMAQGSAVAQAAADLLLLSESLSTLAQGVRTARRMRAVVRQNLGWALAYNLAAVPLAALGWIPPWVAAIGMSTSSLLVVLNAARLARSYTARRTDMTPGTASTLSAAT